MTDPAPGKPVDVGNGVVGIALRRGQHSGIAGEGVYYGANMAPVLTRGEVFVRPEFDVRKHSKVVVLANGALAMRRSGRLPKGAVVLFDARWTADAKAGELTVLELDVAATKQTRRRLDKMHARIKKEIR